MEIEDFVKRGKMLESELAMLISSKLSKFRRETGYSVDHVSVSLIEVTAIGAEHPDYVMKSVTVNVTL